MTERLASLIDSLCRITSVDSRNSGVDDDGTHWSQIEIEGVDFLFLHEPDAPEDFMVYGRLGVVESEGREDFLGLVLRNNLANARCGHAGFGLEAHDDELLYSFKTAFDRAEIGILLDTLKAIARQGEEWRNRQYLSLCARDS